MSDYRFPRADLVSGQYGYFMELTFKDFWIWDMTLCAHICADLFCFLKILLFPDFNPKIREFCGAIFCISDHQKYFWILQILESTFQRWTLEMLSSRSYFQVLIFWHPSSLPVMFLIWILLPLGLSVFFFYQLRCLEARVHLLVYMHLKYRL